MRSRESVVSYSSQVDTVHTLQSNTSASDNNSPGNMFGIFFRHLVYLTRASKKHNRHRSEPYEFYMTFFHYYFVAAAGAAGIVCVYCLKLRKALAQMDAFFI